MPVLLYYCIHSQNVCKGIKMRNISTKILKIAMDQIHVTTINCDFKWTFSKKIVKFLYNYKYKYYVT